MNDLVVARRYRLGRRIGGGGMGRVWLAMDEVLRREVAIKEVLLPEGLTEDDAVELRMRTLREARTAGKVSHPNVIKVYDVIYAEDRPWIVMEYVESRSLAQVIKDDGPMAPEEAASIGLSILAALMAAHQAGVLHRDVKPGNVLLGDTRVVLTDFGLATFDDIGSALTASGVIHGSPQFIAPERALDGTSTAAADMWSLGATLYAAVEGRAPYARASSYATLSALATAPPDPPRHAGALKPVLHGLLRRNPATRMGADEVRAWLRQIADGDGDGTRSRIPTQRRYSDPDSAGSGGSARSMNGPPRTRAAATTPVSHARRNRRPAAGSPGTRNRAPAPDPPPPHTPPPPGVPVASGVPPAGGSKPPSVFAPGQAALVHPVGDLEHDTDHQMDLAWKLDAAAGLLGETAAGFARAGSNDLETGSRRWMDSRRTRWIAAVVCVMAAAAGGAFAIRQIGTEHSSSRAPRFTAPALALPNNPPTSSGSPTPAGAAKATWPCAPLRPASMPNRVAPPTSSKLVHKTAPPDGWRWDSVDDHDVMVPVSWGILTNGDINCFYDLSDTRALGYYSWTPTERNATAELQKQVKAFAAAGHWTDYASSPVTSDNIYTNDAEWEFTYSVMVAGAPLPMHALVYLIYTSQQMAYACFWTTTATDWTLDLNYWSSIQTALLFAN